MVNIKRKRSIYGLIIVLFIFLLSSVLVNAEGLKVFDDAGLFTEEEIISLDGEANNLSNIYNMDVLIVTTKDAQGKSAREYADDYFDYNGFGLGQGRDGILFLIDMDNREAYISTSGLGIRYLTDQRIEDILDRVFDSGLSDGDYYGASMGFLSRTRMYLESGIPSDQYSEDEGVKGENKLTLMETMLGLLGGTTGAGGFFLRTKSKYKMKNPVKPLTFRNNSIINLTSNDDKLIDTFTTNRIIPKPSSGGSSSGKSTTHTSSSGRTHGGGGRKF